MQATSPPVPTPITIFAGALQSTGGTVTGTLHDAGGAFPYCTSISQDLHATGTLDTANNLSLTFQVGGGTATIVATLNSNLGSPATGTYQIVGGSCAMPTTSMTMVEYAPATGTYSGSFTAGPGETTALTAVLTQSTIPNADGEFPLSGTVTATGGCTSSFTFSGGIVMGADVNAEIPNYSENLLGQIDPTASTFNGNIISNPYCPSPYSGTLTRQ